MMPLNTKTILECNSYFLNFKPWSKKSDQTTKPNPPKIINSITVDSTIQSL